MPDLVAEANKLAEFRREVGEVLLIVRERLPKVAFQTPENADAFRQTISDLIAGRGVITDPATRQQLVDIVLGPQGTPLGPVTVTFPPDGPLVPNVGSGGGNQSGADATQPGGIVLEVKDGAPVRLETLIPIRGG